MAYVDYTFYTTQFRGTNITSTEFPSFERKASALVDYATFNRVASIMSIVSPSPEEAALILRIKMAVCSVAEQQKNYEESGGGLISSESVGSHSLSFASTDRKVYEDGLRSAMSVYLGHTGLMYRGFNANE